MNFTFWSRPHSRRLRMRWPILAAVAATLLLISNATAAPSLAKPDGKPVPDSAEHRYFLIDAPLWRMEKTLAPESQRAQLKGYGARPRSPIAAQVRPA